MLARDMEAATLPSGEPDIRVYGGFGGMVGAFAIRARLTDEGVVEAFWLALEPLAW